MENFVEYIISNIEYALSISGGILMAIKLLGLTPNSIIKKCVGYGLMKDYNQKLYVSKEEYIGFLEENLYAVLGFICMFLGVIKTIFFPNSSVTNLIWILISIIAEVSFIILLSFCITKLICKLQFKRLPNLIEVSDKLTENGVIALSIDTRTQNDIGIPRDNSYQNEIKLKVKDSNIDVNINCSFVLDNSEDIDLYLEEFKKILCKKIGR